MKKAELGLGCWAFGEDYWEDQNQRDSVQTIHAALRGGITHYDTASGYGRGKSEQLLAQQIHRLRKEISPERLTIATKIFLPQSPLLVRPLVEKSLRRTGLTRFDILYIHWPDSTKDQKPYLKELSLLRGQKIIDSIGVSNFTPPLLHQAVDTVKVSYCQFPLSILYSRALETIVPICNRYGIRTVGYSPLFLGLLGGNHADAKTLSPTDRRRDLFPFSPFHLAHFQEVLDELKSAAAEEGTSEADIALRWALSQDVDIILTGARRKRQLAENLRSAETPLPSHIEQRLSRLAQQGDSLLPPTADNPFFHRW